MEVTKEENLRILGEEEKRGRKAFAVGYLYGMSLVWIFRKRKIQASENEEDAFNFGKYIGAALAIFILASLIWIFIEYLLGG